MITRGKALQMVRDRLGPDSDVMPDDTVEREYGWVKFSQSREFIKTGDPMMMDIGSGGVPVEKATGKMYDFGSAYSTDENLHIYELGYLQFNKWNLAGRPRGSKLPRKSVYFVKRKMTQIPRQHGVSSASNSNKSLLVKTGSSLIMPG